MTRELLPRFITHREIDPLLGSTRTRERWEHEGLLPPGELVSGFRSAVRIFPDFAVARLAAPRSLERSKTLHRRLGQVNRSLYRSPVFAELRIALKEVLGPKQPVGASQLVKALLPDHYELLQRFAAEIRSAEEALRELDVYVDVVLARVSRCERGFYVVELREGGEREVSRDLTPRSCRFTTGQWVTLHDAKLRGFRRQFLFPTAVLDESLVASRVLAQAKTAAELLQDVLAERPATIEGLTRNRRPLGIREGSEAGRIGVVDTEPVFSPTGKVTVSGLTYAKPAFT